MLRPATAADRDFLVAVYGSTRAAELAQVAWTNAQRAAFVEQQFTAQDTWWRQQRPSMTMQIIEVDGLPAGRLYVDRTPTDIRIVDIALLDGFRGRGIGTTLIGELLAEGAATGTPVSIHVERFNPARALYERLGFVELVGQGTDVYALMGARHG